MLALSRLRQTPATPALESNDRSISPLAAAPPTRNHA
jgi:hypothetical protein